MSYQFKINDFERTEDTDFTWQKCIGNDHAFQMHRSDMLEHLKMVHDELGIQYIRFHGIMNDDMLTYQKLSDLVKIPGSEYVEEVNFHQVGHVYDNVLKAGMKPVVEISFMPSNLASGETYMLHYKINITPPKSYEAWAEYITAFINYLVHRYGLDEIRQWYFEVWNEPDLNTFWAGTQEEYFKLYEYTAKAIKAVDSELRVGGPSTSKNRWIQEFIDFCESRKVPYDFISTHHYPGRPFGNSIDEKQEKMLQAIRDGKGKDITSVNRAMFYDPEKRKEMPKGMLSGQSDDASNQVGGKVPLFYTEWNGTSVFGADVNDTKESAAFVVKTVMDLNHKVQMYAFWCASDMFEEIFFLPKPFHGSFGIVSIDGIPKPNFWGFKMLSKLYPKRIQLPIRTNADVECAAFTDGRNVQVLLYAQSMELTDEKYDVELEVGAEAKNVEVEAIDDVHCNPRQMWIALGCPDNLTPSQVDEIKKATRLSSEKMTFSVKNGKTEVKTQLHTNDVKLISFYI